MKELDNTKVRVHLSWKSYNLIIYSPFAHDVIMSKTQSIRLLDSLRIEEKYVAKPLLSRVWFSRFKHLESLVRSRLSYI